MENIEFVIRENGTIVERTVHERDLQAEESLLEGLTGKVTRSARNVAPIPDWGMVTPTLV